MPERIGGEFTILDAEIISLSDHLAGVEPKLRVLREGACFCTFIFDSHTRTVHCPRCKRAWEPFDAMVHIAKQWVRYAMNRDAIRREVKRLTEKRDLLRSEIQNLQAQKRRASKPEAT